MPGLPAGHCRFAPIYRQPGSEDDLSRSARAADRQHFRCRSQGLRRLCRGHAKPEADHAPALGRKAFVDAVSRADRSIDEIASTFRLPAGRHADQRRCRLARVRGRRLPARATVPLPAAGRSGGGGKEEAVLDRLRPFRGSGSLPSLPREAAGARSAAVDDFGPRDRRFVELSRASMVPSSHRCRKAAEILAQDRAAPRRATTARPAATPPTAVVESAARAMIEGYRGNIPASRQGRTARRPAGRPDGFRRPLLISRTQAWRAAGSRRCSATRSASTCLPISTARRRGCGCSARGLPDMRACRKGLRSLPNTWPAA